MRSTRQSSLKLRRLMAYCVIALWVASQLLRMMDYETVAWILAALPAGVGLATAIEWIQRERREKLYGLLPQDMARYENGDGTSTVLVTRRNGDTTTLVIDGDYDPRQDAGRHVLQQLLPPKLFGMIEKLSIEGKEEE